MTRELKWVPVVWTNVRPDRGAWHFVKEQDIDEFVSRKVCDASIATGMKVEDIISANEEFFTCKSKIFDNYYSLDEDGEILLALESLFVVPVLI